MASVPPAKQNANPAPRAWGTWMLGAFVLLQFVTLANWQVGPFKSNDAASSANLSFCRKAGASIGSLQQSNSTALLLDESPPLAQSECVCGAAALPGWVPPAQVLPLPDYKTLWGRHSIYERIQLERFWNQDTLKNALAVAPTAQMHPVFKKLYRGEPLTVVGVGSSNIQDWGGCYHRSLEDVYELVPQPMPFVYGHFKGEMKGWLELFVRYINNTFPHPNHILINAGLAAYGPSRLAGGTCLEITLPKQADILIIETMGHDDAIGIEKLMWRVWRHFESHGSAIPAVVLYNPTRISADPPPGMQLLGEDCRLAPNWPSSPQPASDYTKCCSNYRRSLDNASWSTTNGGEASHHSLAEYYGIASISHRAFLWRYFKEKAWETMKLRHGECEFFVLVNLDVIHPSRLGQILIADYLWSYFSEAHEAYLQRAELEKSSRPEDGIVLQDKPIFPARSFIPQGREVYSMRCYGYLGSDGNIGKGTTTATSEMGKVSELPIVGGNGFDFTLYTTHGEKKKRKPGWVANSVGAFVDVKVNSLFPTHNAGQIPPANSKPEVVVVYLQSYEHMGMANVSCISGCACDPLKVNAHIKEHISIVGAASVKVTEHVECVIRVQVLPETDSGENKFKITQILTRKLGT